MKSSIKKDLKYRKAYLTKEKKYLKAKSIFENRFLDGKVRENAKYSLNKEGGFISKLQNRCVITGRSRGVLKKYKVSRITFKELASQGYFIGVKKHSW